VEQETTQDIPGAARAPREPLHTVTTTMGAKQRTDRGKTSSSIMLDDGRMIALNHLDKSYFIITLGQAKQGMEMVENASGKAEGTSDNAPKLAATGQKQKIAGYESEEYTFQRTMRGHTTTVRMWIAPEYPRAKEIRAYELAFARANKLTRMSQSSYFGTVIPDPDAIPMGMIMRIETEIPRMGRSVTTTVSAKLAPVDDAIFAIPKDYTERRLPTMPAGR
jgi:hypothetical protein